MCIRAYRPLVCSAFYLHPCRAVTVYPIISNYTPPAGVFIYSPLWGVYPCISHYAARNRTKFYNRTLTDSHNIHFGQNCDPQPVQLHVLTSPKTIIGWRRDTGSTYPHSSTPSTCSQRLRRASLCYLLLLAFTAASDFSSIKAGILWQKGRLICICIALY